MSLRSFLKNLDKHLKGHALLLCSEDQFLLKEALFAVKGAIPQENLDFCYSRFDAESFERPVEQVIDVLFEIPFFGTGGRRVVAIDNAREMTETESSAIGAYLASPAQDALLVLLYETEKGKLKKTHETHFAKATRVSLDMREAELRQWTTDKARDLGLNLSSGIYEYLLATVGPEAGLLSAEVEKLAQWGKLSSGDMEAIVIGAGAFNAFDLSRALLGKDAEKVFKIYASIKDEVEPQNLLGAINWEFSKAAAGGKNLERAFEILNQTDAGLKSFGGYYPLEYMFASLLRL